MKRPMEKTIVFSWIAMGVGMTVVLLLPFVILAFSSSVGGLIAAVQSVAFIESLLLSLRTSLSSLTIIISCGTPVAWWLSRGQGRLRWWASTLFEIPIIIPPAVVGLALLLTFGRRGFLGQWLESVGVVIAFSEVAVILAQVVVAAPFFIAAARDSFLRCEPELWLVARSLGASRSRSFLFVVLPAAMPGLLGGAALAWARALGEFGATLLFAGQMPGVSQTLPLGIYAALEADLSLAIVYALLLSALGLAVLFSLRVILGSSTLTASRKLGGD